MRHRRLDMTTVAITMESATSAPSAATQLTPVVFFTCWAYATNAIGTAKDSKRAEHRGGLCACRDRGRGAASRRLLPL